MRLLLLFIVCILLTGCAVVETPNKSSMDDIAENIEEKVPRSTRYDSFELRDYTYYNCQDLINETIT